jgi:hypothetical protein
MTESLILISVGHLKTPGFTSVLINKPYLELASSAIVNADAVPSGCGVVLETFDNANNRRVFFFKPS